MSAPVRSPDEALANAAFEALLNGMARPGSVQPLPEPGFSPVIAALIDRECVVHAADPLVTGRLMETGARIGAPEEADYLFCAADEAEGLLDVSRTGSDHDPDDGATLIVSTTFGPGTGLRLTGPGIETHTAVSVGGPEAGFWHKRTRTIHYPKGVDLVLIEGTSLVGIPRSSDVEVL